MRLKEIQTLGILIAIPLLLYAIYVNGYWAEPDPPKYHAIYTEEIISEQPEEVYEIHTIEKGQVINE